MPAAKIRSRWQSNGSLAFFTAGGTEVARFDSNGKLVVPDAVRQIRARFTIAQVNAGAEVLPALAGYKYRMVDAAAIAIGGNVATATGVDLTATLSTSRKLVAFKTAGLTQSTLLRAGTATNGVLLADGASFTANDANTAITVIKDGSDVATATHIDILLTYIVEAA